MTIRQATSTRCCARSNSATWPIETSDLRRLERADVPDRRGAPNKHIARRLVDTAISHGERLVTDAEVFQEVMHRYGAIRRRAAIQPAFDLLDQLVDAVLPIERSTVELAHRIMLGHGLSARDAVHTAAMDRADIRTIMSFDSDFDRYPGLHRLSG